MFEGTTNRTHAIILQTDGDGAVEVVRGPHLQRNALQEQYQADSFRRFRLTKTLRKGTLVSVYHQGDPEPIPANPHDVTGYDAAMLHRLYGPYLPWLFAQARKNEQHDVAAVKQKRTRMMIWVGAGILAAGYVAYLAIKGGWLR